MNKFGLFSYEDEKAFAPAFSLPCVFFSALMDREALWNPDTIEKILKAFPEGRLPENELFLILAECMANAVMHGQARTLGFHAREKGGVLLLSFTQIPPMHPRIRSALTLAREGRLRECTEDLPGGLGFPILLRLVHRITASGDLRRLELWIRKRS